MPASAASDRWGGPGAFSLRVRRRWILRVRPPEFLELGGFDDLLAPFYLEDTDLGYLAWKRGWKVLYQPGSMVFHEHRGTIGKRLRRGHKFRLLKKNFSLFWWKNIHEFPRLVSHFLSPGRVRWWGGLRRRSAGPTWRDSGGHFASCRERCSRVARPRAGRVNDTEAFRRPLGGYFRDRFARFSRGSRTAERSVRFAVSDLPAGPWGRRFHVPDFAPDGALAEIHVMGLLDWPSQADDHELGALLRFRGMAGAAPGGPRAWDLSPAVCRARIRYRRSRVAHRPPALFRRIDVVQLEYTPLAQYRGDYRRIAVRALRARRLLPIGWPAPGPLDRPRAHWKARLEYLRALRYELRALPRFDQVQVCTAANRDYLLSFLPKPRAPFRRRLARRNRLLALPLPPRGREPLTMLFVGGFRHEPNRVAVDWFVRRRAAVGSGAPASCAAGDRRLRPPAAHTYADLRGQPGDARRRRRRARSAGALCGFRVSVLSGSGVRVKLLEAFAAGIPVVSTTHRRRRPGAQKTANSARWPTPRRDLRSACWRCSTILRRQPPWPLVRASKWKKTGTWRPLRPELVESYREVVREKRVLLLFQILLEAAYNVGGCAIQFFGARTLGELVYRTRPPGTTWRPPGTPCLCRG